MKHALFDPESMYSKMRAQFRPEDKVWGYFAYLSVCTTEVATQTDVAGEQGLSSGCGKDK